MLDNTLSVVTETFVKYNGMMPDAYQKRLVLSASGKDSDSDGIFDSNVITFYYNSDSQHAYYRVVHYIENIHENYKKKVIAAKDIDSEVTGMSHGHPVRQLRNNMTREYLKLEKAGAPFEELERLTLGALRKAVVEGDAVNGTLMAGQIAGLVKKEETCAEMIQEIMGEAQKLLAR